MEHFWVMKINLGFYGEFLKMIVILWHGQNSLKRGFSANQKILRDNLKEKTVVSDQLIYDNLNVGDTEVHNFLIAPALKRIVVLQKADTRNS